MTLFIFEQSSILEIRMVPQHDPIYIIYLFIYLFIYYDYLGLSILK